MQTRWVCHFRSCCLSLTVLFFAFLGLEQLRFLNSSLSLLPIGECTLSFYIWVDVGECDYSLSVLKRFSVLLLFFYSCPWEECAVTVNAGIWFLFWKKKRSNEQNLDPFLGSSELRCLLCRAHTVWHRSIHLVCGSILSRVKWKRITAASVWHYWSSYVGCSEASGSVATPVYVKGT